MVYIWEGLVFSGFFGIRVLEIYIVVLFLEFVEIYFLIEINEGVR